jgi:hypothetical protein
MTEESGTGTPAVPQGAPQGAPQVIRQAIPQAVTRAAPPAVPPGGGAETERWKEKGVRLRVIFYIAGTHVLAGVLWLFFYIGAHAHK